MKNWDAKITVVRCRTLRDAIPPTPPGPEGSNGNGTLRAQQDSDAWLTNSSASHSYGALHEPCNGETL